jgi:hypothetical protein
MLSITTCSNSSGGLSIRKLIAECVGCCSLPPSLSAAA